MDFNSRPARMGLNSRSAQIFWALVPIALAGLLLALPFVWRALKTKKRGDLNVAAVFVAIQILVYVAFALDSDVSKNATGAVIWFFTFSAAVGAAYVYRPLSKEERMEQAQENRSGSTYL